MSRPTPVHTIHRLGFGGMDMGRRVMGLYAALVVLFGGMLCRLYALSGGGL